MHKFEFACAYMYEIVYNTVNPEPLPVSQGMELVRCPNMQVNAN